MKTMLLCLLAVGLVGCSDRPMGDICLNGVHYTVMQQSLGLNKTYKWLAPWESSNENPIPCKEQQP